MRSGECKAVEAFGGSVLEKAGGKYLRLEGKRYIAGTFPVTAEQMLVRDLLLQNKFDI